ncbi:MAG: sigma-54-dependent Fis family transcriptional regulator [Candidatus Zixiibacteriota bacterium]|nr:MAG: sigma-54-dependent Fis family transcriptional regulator [candidate division Zixibacteria bacterium]
MAKILIVDDEENIRRTLKSALDRRGHETVTADDYKQGREFARADFDLIFLDVLLPDGNGLDLLREILSENKNRIVVMISGHADVDMAVEAIHAGAYDFIEKPLSLERILITVDNADRAVRLLNEKNRLSSLLYGDFIGKSPEVKKLKEDIARSAPKASRFLILGENGTGKELVAHMIHRLGRLPDGPFIAVNCAALPSELVESELFGHVKGAFTGAGKDRKGRFQEANRGSIFLDEISEMSLTAQAKVLRAVETMEISAVGSDKAIKIDCNIIAASNKDLNKSVVDGKFREDLLYRLNVVQFKIPPLRDRKEDIAHLADYFLGKFANESGTTAKKLTEKAIDYLTKYNYPGNIRELKNLMERVHIYCDLPEIGQSDLEQFVSSFDQAESPAFLKDAVARFEEGFINSAIRRNNGNITEAARQLGIERSHLYKKLKRYKEK